MAQKSNEVMEAELLGSDWIWVGKDRKGRRGGGIGILARVINSRVGELANVITDPENLTY